MAAKDMVQITARIVRAGRAVADLIQGTRIILVARILDINHTIACKHLTCAARSAGQDAIHHIDAPRHSAHDIIRLTNAHQVTRFILRQLIRCEVQHVEHRLLTFANSQTTNRIAFKTDLLQRLGAFTTQLLVQPTLLNPKQGMARSISKGGSRPLSPSHRHAHATGNFISFSGQSGAFVKTHDDITAQKLLNFHRPLWRQMML